MLDETSQELINFLELIADIRSKSNFDFSDSPIKIHKVGPKFIRLAEFRPNDDGILEARTCYCFVERATGDIYKGSWKAPVKNGRRGHISSIKGMGVYGPDYLR